MIKPKKLNKGDKIAIVSLSRGILGLPGCKHELDIAIKRLKEYLTMGENSLLDNLIAVSLTSYSDEEVKSLFGFERIKMQYQNGAADLVDAYFALSDNSFALIREKQELIEG